jgi:hypothetical protein
LLIDATSTCALVDIRYPTDLSLRNGVELFSEGVAREVSEVLIDSMVKTTRASFDYKHVRISNKLDSNFLLLPKKTPKNQQNLQGD